VTALRVAGWRELFESETGEILETEILPTFLTSQRWFGGNGRQIDSVRIRDWVELRGYGPSFAIALLRVRYMDGGSEAYSLPLAMTLSHGDTSRLKDKASDKVLGRVLLPDGPGLLHDALIDDSVDRALLDFIRSAKEFRSRRGTVSGKPAGPPERLGATGPQPRVQRSEAELADTTVLYEQKLALKFYRKPERGVRVDVEVARFLTEEAGFNRIPLPAGSIEYVISNDETETLATLQTAIESEGDAWNWTLDELGRFYEYCATSGERDVPGFPRQVLGISLNAVTSLAQFTADLHLALASSTTNAAFAPEPLEAAEVKVILQACREDMETALNQLEQTMRGEHSEELKVEAQRLINRKGDLVRRLRALESSEIRGVKTRIHGNYRLGNVLRVKNDYVIADFQGDTSQPLAERRAKASPLKDVAQMLRSLAYAAQVGLVHHTNRRADEFQNLLAFSQLWEQQTSSRFLGTYRDAVRGARLVPDGEALDQLLEVFILDRMFRELQHEINNRSQWIPIPVNGLLRILDEL
jgi:maltose alpha-D-glucosyltransferase/alpha-amylase